MWKIMKKMVAVFVLLMLALLLAGCDEVDGYVGAYGDGVVEVPSEYRTTENPLYLPLLQRTPQLSLIAGWGSSMLLTEDGELWIWGHVYGGEEWCQWCGADGIKHLEEPVMIMDEVVYAAATSSNLMVIRTDGSLWGWERTWLEDDTFIDERDPTKIMDDVVSVSIGGSLGHLAIRSDGSLWRWGGGFFTFGGYVPFPLYPVMIMENVMDVASGNDFTMALKNDGSLWSWGSNTYGSFGDGANISWPEPAKIMENVIYIAAGRSSAAAIMIDNSLWTWSYVHPFLYDRTAEPNSMFRTPPVNIMEDVIAVTIGSGHFMAIKSDNSLWGWGSNMLGQLGNGTYIFFHGMNSEGEIAERAQDYQVVRELEERGLANWSEALSEPIPIKIMDNVRSVSTLHSHTLVITMYGQLLSFGANHAGELGNSTTVSSSALVIITILDEILSR